MAKTLDIRTMKNGYVAELVNKGLREVAEDVQDLEREATAKRSVTLTIEFDPSTERDYGKFSAKVKTKLANRHSITSSVFFGRDAEGTPAIAESDTRQQEMPLGDPQ